MLVAQVVTEPQCADAVELAVAFEDLADGLADALDHRRDEVGLADGGHHEVLHAEQVHGEFEHAAGEAKDGHSVGQVF